MTDETTEENKGKTKDEAVDEISIEELDALIKRIESDVENKLSLEPDDVKLIVKILRQFALLHQKLEDSSYLKKRYLKLLGLVSSSENQESELANGKASGKRRERKKKQRPKATSLAPKVCHHKLEGLENGQLCPECESARIYKTEPASFIRIVGQPPLTAENHIFEQLRCRICDAFFTAQAPEEVLQDGVRGQKYGYSARSMISIYKFFMGDPYYRQESLQSLLGCPVSASTAYDQCVLLVADVSPVVEHMKLISADASMYDLDDTGNRILEEKSKELPNRNGKGDRIRTGIYTSSLIATLPTGHQVALFKTNIGHAGEWIDEILSKRSEGLPLPNLMCDALSHNRPTVAEYALSLCNSHGRRKFTEVIDNFPKEVNDVIELYGTVWHNETHVEKENMSPAKRLAYHKEHSYPQMLKIKQWCEKKLKSCEKTEENNGLGKAMKYFVKHFEGLSAFCRIEGAKLDNNLVESIIKLIARGRKNAMFYKTQAGADVGDVITSLIATCQLNNVNIYDYLTSLQRHRRSVELNPERWLPWNYQENLEQNHEVAA